MAKVCSVVQVVRGPVPLRDPHCDVDVTGCRLPVTIAMQPSRDGCHHTKRSLLMRQPTACQVVSITQKEDCQHRVMDISNTRQRQHPRLQRRARQGLPAAATSPVLSTPPRLDPTPECWHCTTCHLLCLFLLAAFQVLRQSSSCAVPHTIPYSS